MLGLCRCVWSSLVVTSGGRSRVVVLRLLITVASLGLELRLQGSEGSVVAAAGL